VDEPCEYRFSMSDRGESLSVSYESCVIPDTFREVPWTDVEVSAEGEQCQGCHDFKASLIMAKSLGKFEMRPMPFPPVPRCPGRRPGT
jgi:cytochrome c-type biogenesis protein CcmE